MSNNLKHFEDNPEARHTYIRCTNDAEIAEMSWGDVILDGAKVDCYLAAELSADGISEAWTATFKNAATARLVAEALAEAGPSAVARYLDND